MSRRSWSTSSASSRCWRSRLRTTCGRFRPAKWVLRRFDHSAIYLLIAGTYTPFLMQMKNVLASASLSIGVWLSAGIGMALKLALPGRFDRLAVVLCLLLGWSGVMALRASPRLDSATTRITAGGHPFQFNMI